MGSKTEAGLGRAADPPYGVEFGPGAPGKVTDSVGTKSSGGMNYASFM